MPGITTMLLLCYSVIIMLPLFTIDKCRLGIEYFVYVDQFVL